MRIFLIGFMGCGKTLIGKKLAEKLKYDFYDIDTEIEKIACKSVIKIFEEDGESRFREFEKQVLLSLSAKNKAVIATGGGTPCFDDNMEIIKKTGLSVYIKLSAESLFERLETTKKTRPLIASKNKSQLHSFITELLKQREPCYLKADRIIKGEKANANNIASLIFN